MTRRTHPSTQQTPIRLLVTLLAISLPIIAATFLSGSLFRVDTLKSGQIFDASAAHAAVPLTTTPGATGTETGTPDSTTTPGATGTGTAVSTGTGTPGSTGTPGGTGTAVGTTTPGATTTGTPQPTCSPIANVAVSITDSSFNPSSITVDPGTRVTWTNNGSTRHRVRDINHVLFDSDDLQPGQSFSYIFCVPGSYPYHDARSGFTGVVNVTGTPPTTTPGTTGTTTPGATGTGTAQATGTGTPGSTTTTTPQTTQTAATTTTPGATGTGTAQATGTAQVTTTATAGTTGTTTPGATGTGTAQATGTGTAQATGTAQVTGTPGSAQLTGHVNWQGRPAQPHSMQQVPFTLVLQSGPNQYTYTGVTTSSGSFTVDVSALSYGTYTWRVTSPRFLANSGPCTLNGSLTNVEMGLMRAGDANGDNVVNALDFNILRASFGLSSGQSGYDDRADFTGDGTVGSLDFNLVRTNFGTSGN